MRLEGDSEIGGGIEMGGGLMTESSKYSPM